MQHIINKFLSSVGMNPNGDPIFRLVWSDDQTELRRGEFNEFYGDIYLRTATGVRRVKKYPWIQSKWLIEYWQPPNPMYFDELPESTKGTYEPLYPFEDRDHNPLPLSLKVAEMVVHAALTKTQGRKYTLRDEEDKLKKDETQRNEDMINTSWIQNALRMRQAVGYGS